MLVRVAVVDTTPPDWRKASEGERSTAERLVAIVEGYGKYTYSWVARVGRFDVVDWVVVGCSFGGIDVRCCSLRHVFHSALFP